MHTPLPNKVRARLATDHRILDAGPIAVSNDDGATITLRGTVATLGQRRAAAQDAHKVDGAFQTSSRRPYGAKNAVWPRRRPSDCQTGRSRVAPRSRSGCSPARPRRSRMTGMPRAATSKPSTTYSVRGQLPSPPAHDSYAGNGYADGGRRRDARNELRMAQEMFDSMRIGAFDERARIELLATGEHARQRKVATRDELTPQEAQIRRLASNGHSNREFAAPLFISPSTVADHLREIFRKLDVNTRTRLRRALVDEVQPQEPTASQVPYGTNLRHCAGFSLARDFV